MKIIEIDAETTFVNDPVAPSLSLSGLDLLAHKYGLSEKKQHGFYFGQNTEAQLHDIFRMLDSKAYIPPFKLKGLSKSYLVFSGVLELFFFNDAGRAYDFRRLSASSSGLPFYLRVPQNTWHGYRCLGEEPCLLKETICGPYANGRLKVSPFAPNDASDFESGHSWYSMLKRELTTQDIHRPDDEIFEQESDNVFRSFSQIVSVNLDQLNRVKEAAFSSPLKRARLCCHSGPEEKLQEMFIALANGANIAESVHIRKDESLTLISGKGRYLFFNQDGTQRDIFSLGSITEKPEKSDRFYTRINRYVPHKIEISSNMMLIHEATTGPFNPDDTDYQLWGSPSNA